MIVPCSLVIVSELDNSTLGVLFDTFLRNVGDLQDYTESYHCHENLEYGTVQ
jgi:hypothetical protein